MSLYYKIHIGNLIKERVIELNYDTSRLCKYLKLSETALIEIYKEESLETKLILKFSKILNYDFFRIYSQHLILYSPKVLDKNNFNKTDSSLPHLRKNVYTKEIIDYVLHKIKSKELTAGEIINRYNIPKNTLYKWIKKYNQE